MINPIADKKRSARLTHGGYWYGSTDIMQASYQIHFYPTRQNDLIGFRIVRSK